MDYRSKHGFQAQLGQVHGFRVERDGGKERLACTADLGAELPESLDGVTVNGYSVTGSA